MASQSVINQKLHMFHHICKMYFREDCLPGQFFPFHHQTAVPTHPSTPGSILNALMIKKTHSVQTCFCFHTDWLHSHLLAKASAFSTTCVMASTDCFPFVLAVDSKSVKNNYVNIHSRDRIRWHIPLCIQTSACEMNL